MSNCYHNATISQVVSRHVTTYIRTMIAEDTSESVKKVNRTDSQQNIKVSISAGLNYNILYNKCNRTLR